MAARLHWTDWITPMRPALPHLSISDEQQMLVDTLQRLLAETNDFETRRHHLAQKPPQRMALWPQLAETGLLGAGTAPEHGGFDGSATAAALVMHAIGHNLTVEPWLASAVVATRVLAHAGEQGQTLIDAIISGEQVWVLAHDGGHDPFNAPDVQHRAQGDGAHLQGCMGNVVHADVATGLLVVSQGSDGLAVHALPINTAGLTLLPHRRIDGAGAADLVLDVQATAAQRLTLDGDARQILDEAIEWGLLGLVAETAGIAQAVNQRTFAYLNDRRQFGTKLASFQALQHRAADMQVAEEELGATLASTVALFEQGSPGRHAAVSGAKAMADRLGRLIGHSAIQLHGGMGVSDELDISHYGRRLAAIRTQLGSADTHRLRYARLRKQAGQPALALVHEDAELAAWRAEVAAFVDTHLPDDLARKVAVGLKIEKDDYVRWQQILRQHGWFAGAWPVEHGGQGWDLRRQLVFLQEAAVRNAPMIIPYGVNMLGPVLYTYGTEQQRAEHLPGILDSTVWWSQGYSEPGAGSDLSALKTQAVRESDHYIVNGSKMWTTEAHWGDKLHCLVRTSNEGKPQQGISFLLIDIDSPGISISPIVTIDGLHHTNQVFFDNVRVPVANLVGAEGQGWSIAKFLLGNERTSIADTGPKLRLLGHLHQLHAGLSQQRGLDPAIFGSLSLRLADLDLQLQVLCALERQYVDAWAKGATPGYEASILKIRGTELLQDLAELALEMEGPLAGAHDPHDLHLPVDHHFSPAQKASMLGHEYLYSRCWSIFGGTNEIQRNIIARCVLG